MEFLHKYRQAIFLIFTFSILFVSYAYNPFKIENEDYRFFDRADEGNVMGRVMLSKHEGILARGGITGQFNYSYANENERITLDRDDPNKTNTQVVTQMYDDYINDREVKDWTFFPYKSQPGGHAMMYSFIQKISPLSGGLNLALFRFITIALSALAFALLAGWTYRNFGFRTAITLFLLIVLSSWFHRFAFNLWWALWSYYIPFLTMLLVLERRQKKEKKLFDGKLLIYLFIAVFVKFFYTGAEFVTSTLVTAICPIIYYLIISSSKLKFSIQYFIKASLVSISAIVLGLLQLAMQIRYLDGSWEAGFNHVIYSFVKHNSDPIYPITPFPELISIYLTGSPFKWDFFPYITFGFGWLVVIISLFSVLVYKLNKAEGAAIRLKNMALIITTTISIAGPLSWIILFPSHASYHTFIDFLVWYLPYSLYGFIVIGVGIDLMLKRIKEKYCKNS